MLVIGTGGVLGVIAYGTGSGPSQISCLVALSRFMPSHFLNSVGISYCHSMTVAVESIELLMGFIVCGMMVHPSTGVVLCHLCGKEAELLPLDSCFISTFGLGQHIWMWYPLLSASGKHHLSFRTFSHLIAVIRPDKTEPTYHISYHIKHRNFSKLFCMK